MYKKIILLPLISCSIAAFGQVGIDTENPRGTFHIDGAINNNETGGPTTAQQADDVIVTSTGNMGIGTSIPTNKLHIAATTNPLKLEGVVQDNDADIITNYDLIVRTDGTIKKLILATSPSVPGNYIKLVAMAGFNDQVSGYTTSSYGNSIYGTIFKGARYDPGNTYNNTTGVFTAPATGYYTFESVLLLWNSANADLRNTNIILGISKPGEITFPNGAGSFAALNQVYPATNSTLIPIVIPFSGMQKLQQGQQVAFGVRFVNPSTMTLQVSNMNYDVTTTSYMVITYLGNSN